MDALLHTLQPFLVPAFALGDIAFSWLEIVACLLSIAMVVLNMRVNPWAWPLAITASLLYMVVFWNSKLYGEGSLQIVFALLAAWGWWQWLRGHGKHGVPLHIRQLSPLGRAIALVALAVMWPALAGLLAWRTDSDVPWWDAFPTAASLIGQWLLGRKFVENWPAWVVVNTATVALLVHKQLWLTAGLYGVFLGMSFAGWRAWHLQLEQASPQTRPLP